MKKKIIGGIALLTIALTFAFIMDVNAKKEEYDPDNPAPLEWMDHPLGNEGGNGTSVSTCYQNVSAEGGTGKFFIKCSSSTSSTMIYPCPAPISAATGNAPSMCTTK